MFEDILRYWFITFPIILSLYYVGSRALFNTGFVLLMGRDPRILTAQDSSRGEETWTITFATPFLGELWAIAGFLYMLARIASFPIPILLAYQEKQATSKQVATKKEAIKALEQKEIELQLDYELQEATNKYKQKVKQYQ